MNLRCVEALVNTARQARGFAAACKTHHAGKALPLLQAPAVKEKLRMVRMAQQGGDNGMWTINVEQHLGLALRIGPVRWVAF